MNLRGVLAGLASVAPRPAQTRRSSAPSSTRQTASPAMARASISVKTPASRAIQACGFRLIAEQSRPDAASRTPSARDWSSTWMPFTTSSTGARGSA